MSKRLIDDLDRLISAHCPQWYVYNFSEAYRSLDTKMHMATALIGKMMMTLAAKANAPPPEPQPAPVVEAPPAPKP